MLTVLKVFENFSSRSNHISNMPLENNENNYEPDLQEKNENYHHTAHIGSRHTSVSHTIQPTDNKQYSLNKKEFSKQFSQKCNGSIGFNCLSVDLLSMVPKI
jgi:hypothetical protein